MTISHCRTVCKPRRDRLRALPDRDDGLQEERGLQDW